MHLNFRPSRRVGWWISVAALFVACVALKLNGSSVGVWQQILREPGAPKGLLVFTPRHIRADEWYVVTPSMLSQARHIPPFPIRNESLGGGLSPLLMSVPVAYYTTSFRPQLWGFFIFDFEHAFAFYWCCKVFGLLLAFAWLLRQIGIERRTVVICGTIWLFFSSFTQWWFSSPAMLPEMLACWAICTGSAIRFFDRKREQRTIVVFAAFVFFGINFALCLYPGFQVPLIYVSIAMFVGFCWEHPEACDLRRGGALLAAAIITIAIVLIPFWLTIRDTLAIVSHTAYPGVFRSSGGALTIPQLFSGALGFFESEQRVPLGFDNICEASNFYPLWLFAALGTFAGAVRRRPMIIALLAVTLIFSIYCVVPLPGYFGKATLFSLTTEGRLFIGIGIAGILLCCAYCDAPAEVAPGRTLLLGAAAAIVCVAIGIVSVRSGGGAWQWLVVVINTTIAALFFVVRARKPFLICFVSLVTISGMRINPVMSGLAPLLESHAFRDIAQLHASDRNARWIAYENLYFAQLVKATGASVLNGTKVLPDIELMRALDPKAQFLSIYNRYAYINVLLPEQPDDIQFSLVDFNYYDLKVSPDADPLRDSHYDFAIFPRPWSNAELHSFGIAEEIAPTGLYVYKRKWSLGDSNP